MSHKKEKKEMKKMSNSDNWEWVPHNSVDNPKSYKESVWAKNRKQLPISETDEIAIFHDAYPTTDDHRLYIPKINIPRLLGLCMAEAYLYGLEQVENGKCDGFNIGLNVGECAGQSVFWPHVHYIPRINGDQEPGAKGIRTVYPNDAYNPKNKKPKESEGERRGRETAEYLKSLGYMGGKKDNALDS